MRTVCCKLWKDKLSFGIVESKLSAVNCGMRCFLLQIVKSEVFPMNCLMRKSCSKLWNENCLLQIVEYEIFATDCGMRIFCCKLWNEQLLLQAVE